MLPELKKSEGKNEKEEEKCSQLDLAKLAEFIFYSISGGGKLSC